MTNQIGEGSRRTPFPPVFWVANFIEILERFAYYGIYFGFGIYMTHLGYSKEQLGIVQSLFLLLSYAIPLVSGTFADRFGFKKVLIISYLAYLPSILLLMLTKSFSGIALTMLSIGLAAGIFKPLIAATVRVTTDGTNKTLGFGIFYAMVNIGGSFGPIVAGKLRAISWNYAFLAAAIAIGLMLVITVLFYKEPPREIEGQTLAKKFRDIGTALADVKFLVFLVLLGIFFWLPFWAFFNLCALYVDSNLDTAALYQSLRSVFGAAFADFLSEPGKDGTRRILGETISHTGYIIMIFQLAVSRVFERRSALPSFMIGLVIMAAGLAVLGLAKITTPTLVFLGIFLFGVGEMITSPRIQEYITWIAPKEKAGLYMGSNFLAVMIGGFTSGFIYTSLYGHFNSAGSPERVWFVMAAHVLLAVLAFAIFRKAAGDFREQTV
ncbi:MAG TPA: MFS transporter [Candidatus Limnocylindrales bacterium]|jgi:dipeptide/tripeptide permease|nr:MFS transporter [Candidatus Limnocylindrales bacterium]